MDLSDDGRGAANARRAALLAAALALITIGTLSPLFRADFADWDDKANLAENPNIMGPGVGGLGFLWSHTYLDLYIPVTETAWWGLARRQPLDAGLFHALNVLAHVGTVMAVFGILRAVLGKDWAAAGGALLFAVHPVQVEAVGWVSGLKDVLAGFFGFAAIWVYVAGIRSGRRGGWVHAAAVALFALAVLSKAGAMVMPVIAAAIAIFAMKRPVRRTLVELTPWFLLAGAAAVVARIGQPAHAMGRNIPLWARPLIAGDCLAFYLQKLVAPVGLVVSYGRTFPGVMRNYPYPAWWTWMIPAAVLGLAWMNRRQWPMGWTAAIVFIAGVLPMLGLAAFDFQIYSNVADHYLYAAMLGPALAAASLLGAGKRPKAIAAAVAPVFAVLCVLSFQQARTWMSDRAIFTHLLEVLPNNWVGMHNLCDDALSRGDFFTAEADARAYVAANPGDPKAYIDLGAALRAEGGRDEAAQAYQRAIQINPSGAWGYIGLGETYEEGGRFDLAIGCYEEALRLDSSNGTAQAGLARAREETAMTRPSGDGGN